MNNETKYWIYKILDEYEGKSFYGSIEFFFQDGEPIRVEHRRSELSPIAKKEKPRGRQ